MNPQKARALLKVGMFFASMMAFGALHKADKALNVKIDERYPKAKSETPQEN